MIKKLTLLSSLLVGACNGVAVPPSSPEAFPLPVPAVAAVEAPVAVYQPATVDALSGLSPFDVINRMGSPSLVRRDGLGQVMLFEHESCVFDIVFYADTIESPYKVAYISARTRDGSKSDRQQCLQALKPNGFDQ